MTNDDLQKIDSLIKKNLKDIATKKDLQNFATKKDLNSLRREIKNDIDDAVAQITTAVVPLEERVEEVEDRLGIVNP